MYDYRCMSVDERQEALRYRKDRGFPLHAPPHDTSFEGRYLITAACFQHAPNFDSPSLLSYLNNQILDALEESGLAGEAWVFQPNHYHN